MRSILSSLKPLATRSGLRASSLRTVMTRAEVERRVSHILVKEEAAIDEILKKLKSGGDFASMAKEFSQCPSGKSSGGDLGWVNKGQMVKPFEEASFTAEMLDFVKVNTQFGWHVLQVTDEREPVTVQQITPNELKEMLENPALSEDVLFIDVREQWVSQKACFERPLWYRAED